MYPLRHSSHRNPTGEFGSATHFPPLHLPFLSPYETGEEEEEEEEEDEDVSSSLAHGSTVASQYRPAKLG